METKIDEIQKRQTETKWDGAGRSTLVATAGRAVRQRFAQNGRLEESVAGAGTLAGITTAFQSVTATAFDGPLLTGAAIAEKGSVPIAASYGYDTLVHPTRQQVGSLAWEQRFDADGNVAAARSPARPETTFAYDAVGNVTAETKPGGATIHHGYAASGAHESYRDPADEVTATTTDRIGRPLVRTYVDGTTETYTYDGERIAATTDREGRTFSSTYNDKGQLIELRAGGGELLEKYGYDPAGRLEKWTTRDAELRYENFDLEGRPRHTRQIRFADRSGFTTAVVLDEYAQDHEWNVHGERKAWTMPLPAGFAAPGWTRRVEEEHDAAGNVTSIQRTLTGATALAPLMSADYRGAGRPNVRTITTTSGSAIARNYGYDASTGQLNDLTVTAGGLIVAGSRIEYDGTQIAKATLHGVSNETRANQYGYDDRSRLASSTAARTNGTSALAIEHVDHADFRTALERTDSGPQSLPSLAFVQQPGHKIAQLARNGSTRTFSYGGGAERVDDGRFVYELDARGRLIATTEKPTSSSASTRRIQYFYSPADRVIGRRAEYKPAPAAAWQLEDRAAVLSDDGLPAEETFVWDPVTDTLVTVATLNGEPLRQIIHGGNTYDDPIEVAVAEAGTVHRLHPVFDEAGAGTLQIILNQQGQVVSRTIEEGAYGEDEFGLAGPAVDRIAIAATKDAAGVLQTVTVSIRTTEQLAPATIAAGARLTVLDATGAVIRSSTATPALFDNYTLRWTLPAAAWTTLTSPAGDPKKLSIAVTNTLRAVTWDATQPILPAPQWATSPAGTMYSTPALPVEYRQPLSDLTTWLTTTTTEKVLFEAPALSTLAGHSTPAARLIVVAGFQALPFQEPATGLVFARGRWYEPQTGTFLSPDPLGYKDSSNLYAFAGGDPVNGRDPTGTSAAPLRDGGAYIRNVKTDARYKISRRQAEEDPVALQDLLMIEGGLSAQEAKDFLQDIGLTYTHSYQRPVVRPDLPKGDNWIKNAIIATSGLPAQNRQQEIVQGGLQIVSSVAIIGATNAYRGTVTARPEMGVGPYQYGRAGDLKARSFPRDGLDIDHQPSTASLLARAEAELGRPLTPAEIQQIMADGMAVAVPVEWHRGKSRTYGGRNKPEKISADAADPANAATLDSQAMIEGAMPAKRQVAREAADAVRKRAAGQ
jgi:RHS repeat-associated protein